MYDHTVIHEFEKNARERVRFTRQKYKNREIFDIRLWFSRTPSEEPARPPPSRTSPIFMSTLLRCQ